ncbi:MAG: cupin domain-containing protein [Chloroflexi bacterium]|nr:cupin domain-containing protein [Chloroflexota bacterium]
MEHPKYTAEGMAKRVVRFDELKHQGIPLMFIDSILPQHWRMNYAVIGDTASENPDFAAKRAITDPHKFQIGMGFAPPGCGPAWHTHDYVEMFFILEGQWRFVWGYNEDPEKPDGEFILNKWDMISLPAGVWRRFEVCGAGIGWFFAVLEAHEVFTGKDPYWPPSVIQQAEAMGFRADEAGQMVKPANYDQLNQQQYAHLLKTFKDLSGTDLAEFSPNGK